jgi:hypothetical protein
MHIYDKLFFWVVLAIVGALVVGFTVAHFYDGVTGGKVAAIYMILVAIAATIQIIRYQKKNP